MKIAVVILNWNGRELLGKFLPSVLEHSQEATIYVADNASTDTSVAFVSENFPTVKIIRNKTNGGYARGYNEALRSLTEDIYILLNSDVEVTRGWLKPVLSEFEKNTDVVAAQPKILDYKNREYFEYAGAAGGFVDLYGYPFCRGRIFTTLEKDVGQYNDTSKIFWASGACLFVRSTSFWEIGGFDEDYFAHQEEIDLCWRLHKKGGNVLYVGKAAIYHVGGATLDSARPEKTFYNFRNSLFNLLKNVDGNKVYGLVFVRMVLDALAAFQFLFQGKPQHFLAVIRAHMDFYRLFSKFRRKRVSSLENYRYYYIISIVNQYFIRKRKLFTQLL